MGPEDRAAHSFGNRRTKRTEVMFGGPGLIYTYQMHTHTLINVVAGMEGIPNAILIRAVEPVEGLKPPKIEAAALSGCPSIDVATFSLSCEVS